LEEVTVAEHREAPKNPQNPTEKSDSEYQPLWDMEQPAPEYSALLLHGTPVPPPTGGLPAPAGGGEKNGASCSVITAGTPGNCGQG